MSIFTETIAKAIRDYRYLLRRNLTQAERTKRLNHLNLNDSKLYESDTLLYRTAHLIVRDIEDNIGIPDQGYYSYSGIGEFCKYLKEYLANYEVENGRLIHRAQKASKAMLEAIQLVSMSTVFDDALLRNIYDCNKIIATYGSTEQQELYKLNLERQICRNEEFFEPVLIDFERRQQLVKQERLQQEQLRCVTHYSEQEKEAAEG